jgi:hypothetical protein
MSQLDQAKKGIAWPELGILLISVAAGVIAGFSHRGYEDFVMVGVLSFLALSIAHVILAFVLPMPKPRWGIKFFDFINWISGP